MPVALGLALGPAVALGLARFSYALLLPPMRTSLGWSFAQAGLMNTSNALGYLGGALVADRVGRQLAAGRAFLLGIATIGVALLASAITDNFALLLALRLVAGAAGAVTFILGAGLAAQVGAASSPARAASLLGVYFGGGGLGIVVSGLAVPPILAAGGGGAWRMGWVALGCLSLVALVVSIPAVRRAPDLPVPLTAGTRRWPVHRLGVTLAAYILFGAGYIAYMTFIVAFLRTEGVGATQVTLFWALLGAAAVASPFAWGPVLGRLRGGRGVAVTMAVVSVGALLPLLSRTGGAAFGSALLFGAAFLAVVTAVTAVARRSLHRHHWTSAIAALTVAFAVGQCLGPVLAGTLSDGRGGVRVGLVVSTVVLACGAVVALAQRHSKPGPAPT